MFQIWDWYHKKWVCEPLYQQRPLGDIHVQLMIPKGHLETTWPHTTAKIDILFYYLKNCVQDEKTKKIVWIINIKTEV